MFSNNNKVHNSKVLYQDLMVVGLAVPIFKSLDGSDSDELLDYRHTYRISQLRGRQEGISRTYKKFHLIDLDGQWMERKRCYTSERGG